MQAICSDTLLVPSSSPIAAEMQEAGRNYHFTREEQKNTELGPPHYHVFLALLRKLMEPELLQKLAEEARAPVADLLKEFKEADEIRMGALVRQCRITKCWNQGMHKIQLAMPECKERETVLRALVAQEGIILKQGRAPQSGRERELSQLLSRMGLDDRRPE